MRDIKLERQRRCNVDVGFFDLPTAFRMFMTRSKMVKGLPFEATLPETTITRADAKNAFYELREQAADVPEMSLDEINAEISAVRAERKR